MQKEHHCRCPWLDTSKEDYVAYHDQEWGVPLYDDHRLFEFITLSSKHLPLGEMREHSMSKTKICLLSGNGWTLAIQNADSILMESNVSYEIPAYSDYSIRRSDGSDDALLIRISDI